MAKRVDGNHAEIVQALRQVGAELLDIHEVPGALDLLCGFRGVLTLLELKDGNKVASARRLTPAEADTVLRFTRVGCPVYVVNSVEEALHAVGAI